MSEPEDYGFVAPAKMGDDTETLDVFTELLRGVEDDPKAVEPTDDDYGTLEEEWQKLCALKHAHQRAEEREKETKAAYEAQRIRMRSAMTRQGTQQFRGANGGGCSVTQTYTTALENEESFMAWVKETHPELLSVHSQTRTSFIRREYRDKGVAIDDPSFPPGLKAGTLEGLQVRGTRPPTETQGD